MIATGNFFHIQPSTYRPASSPLKHAWMVPIGSINLFVGLTGVSDPTEPRPGRSHDPFAPGQLLTATRPVTGEVYAEAESALEDGADSAAVAPVADSIVTASAADSIVTIPATDLGVATFDADSVATASAAGSAAASPTAGSIAAASFKDSISLVSHPSDFEDDSVLSLFGSDSDSDTVEAPRYRYPTAVFMAGGEEEPPVDAFTTPLPATATATEIEAHRAALEEQRKKELAERQKFRLEQDEVRAVSHYRQQRNRLRMERARANDFPSARLNFDDPDGEIRVARVQNPDIPEGSRAAADRAAHGAPPPPPPPPPEVPRAEVDANGLPLHSSPADNVAAAQAVLARLPETGDGAILVQHAKALVAKALEQQHAAADSQGRLYSRTMAGAKPANDRYADEAPRQSAFTRVGPACFGPMIRGEPYPAGFKGPRDIEKYDTHIDPTVWIDSYAMEMGIQGHSEFLAARYLPLMMDGVNRHWFNTLTANSIDSWEEARAAFIQHFASAYTRATTIEDLDRCVQGPRESTRRWVQRWQDMWTTSSGISTDTAIYCSDDAADPTVDSDDEYGQRRNRRPVHTEPRCGDYRFAGRSNNGKRRGEGGHNELVANADYEQREPKSFQHDNRAPQEDRPQPKRFDARSLLDAPCIYHSKEGKPSNHTTGNCPEADREGPPRQGKRRRKVLARAVAVHAVILSTCPVAQLVQAQHYLEPRRSRPRIEYPGRVALVVGPRSPTTFENPMDGGSSINILYYETFHSGLTPREHQGHVPWHRPRAEGLPDRQGYVAVTFGTPVNYRTERITFEVVNFRSSYHRVLGRQRSLRHPHYAYNMMKMPGPRGVITVHGDPEMAMEWATGPQRVAARPSPGRAAIPPHRLVPLRLRLFAYIKVLDLKPRDEKPRHEKLQSRRHREAKIWGQDSPFRRTGTGSAPEGSSIDTTAIFINAAVSHEEGVVLHRGSGYR
ncbi:hypothetical protein QYE76_039214 [Lolium multiflorum]|uniref:Retrotransposon gag domain-containing protein n=1 Tax=Lolium multiflorum TaxID=4521 RepID=A0AAD8T9H2_LOLMU|nr:hypothetical protein QYE76_039214 [Lolium multiflorum]